MEHITNKLEKVLAGLLHQRSTNYLIRSKIDQNIAITHSNLTASFMGNRQLANHNTADIKYNLTKIAENKLSNNKLELEIIETFFLKHQQKLNKQLIENSKELVLALEQMQRAHRRVMKTNEDIVKFNTSLINTTSKVIETDHLPEEMMVDEKQLLLEIEKIQAQQKILKKETEKLLLKTEKISITNTDMSTELNMKREKIIENRERISSLRADLQIFL